MPAKMRLTRELSLLSNDPPPGISCYAVNDSMTQLHATITGPPSTPFATGIFLLSITIPSRYPFEPPRVRFLTPIHHPNIDSAGRICLDTLKSNGSWSPAVSLPSLLLSIRSLMGEPNGEDGLVAEITSQFKRDREGWICEAKNMTEREATEEKLLRMEESLKGKNVPKTDKNSEIADSIRRRNSSTMGKENLRNLVNDVTNSQAGTTLAGKRAVDEMLDNGSTSTSYQAPSQSSSRRLRR